MANYRYIYTKDGKPAHHCPECLERWTNYRGVYIVLSVAGRTLEVPSYLGDDGRLIDTDDGAVAHGHHSDTYCAGCGEDLHDLVDETVMEE